MAYSESRVGGQAEQPRGGRSTLGWSIGFANDALMGKRRIALLDRFNNMAPASSLASVSIVLVKPLQIEHHRHLNNHTVHHSNLSTALFIFPLALSSKRRRNRSV